MNRLLIPNGGMPFQGDDIRWDQDSVREALRVASAFFTEPWNGTVCLSGCEVDWDGTTASISEGFVCLGNEFCYVPAHTLATTDLATASIKIVETYDASGLEVFGDGVSRNTYAIRRGRATAGLAGSNELVLSSVARMSTLVPLNTDVQDFAVSYEGGFGDVINNGIFTRVTRSLVQPKREVFTKGKCVGIIPTDKFDSTHIFTVNSACHPTHDMSFLLLDELDDTHLVRCAINTSGQVRLTTIAGGTVGDQARFCFTNCWILV